MRARTHARSMAGWPRLWCLCYEANEISIFFLQTSDFPDSGKLAKKQAKVERLVPYIQVS